MMADQVRKSITRLEQGGAGSDLLGKWWRLVEKLQAYPPAVVAFSGGVDSSFLSNAVYLVQGSQMLAITVDSGLDTPEQRRFATEFAQEIGFPHRVLEFSALDVPEIVANPPDRCYFCKRAILSRLWGLCPQHGYGVVWKGKTWTTKPITALAGGRFERPERPVRWQTAV